MWVGISIGLLVCSKGVHTGELTVGDLVLFLSLMAQVRAQATHRLSHDAYLVPHAQAFTSAPYQAAAMRCMEGLDLHACQELPKQAPCLTCLCTCARSCTAPSTTLGCTTGRSSRCG